MQLLAPLMMAVSLHVCTVLAAPSEDLVTNLPGLGWKPNFKQYSGYLQSTGTRKLHYWFVESSSNPQTDPVVLWLNGGPGCSSMEGMLAENGPFTVQADGATLKPNPFSWNHVANMIYMEAPAGVGYSYNDEKDYNTDDDQVAKANHAALQNFFKKFPEYAGRDFYISGESYGGIYIPTLADSMLSDSSINLKGYIVGNGLSDNAMNDNSIVYFAYYHGLIGDSQFETILDVCCGGKQSVSCDFTAGGEKSAKCMKEMTVIQGLVWGSGLNVYNLYQECAGGVQDGSLRYDHARGRFVTSQYLHPWRGMKKTSLLGKVMPTQMVSSSPPCTNDTALSNYLNTQAVRQALHIPSQLPEWELCSGPVGAGYKRLYTTMAPQYQRALAKKLKIMLYNGDVDMACNFLGDEWFVDSLNDSNPQERRAWYYEAADGTKQVAGYYKEFDHISFVTVRGSGHMVPTDKPRPALKLFISFIQDQPL